MLVIDKIRTHAESIVNSEPQSLANMEPLDEWRQGDVRIIRLPDDFDMTHLKKLEKVPTQLAPGSTIGSRHCLASTDGVTAYELKESNALDGPVLRFDQPNSVTHPEHGHCVEMPAGLYAFPGQRSYADELRRVVD